MYTLSWRHNNIDHTVTVDKYETAFHLSGMIENIINTELTVTFRNKVYTAGLFFSGVSIRRYILSSYNIKEAGTVKEKEYESIDMMVLDYMAIVGISNMTHRMFIMEYKNGKETCKELAFV